MTILQHSTFLLLLTQTTSISTPTTITTRKTSLFTTTTPNNLPNLHSHPTPPENALPLPLAGHTISTAPAPNDEGILESSIYVTGGCTGGFLPEETPPSVPSPPLLLSTNASETTQPQQQPRWQYRCAELSPHHHAYTPTNPLLHPTLPSTQPFLQHEPRRPLPHPRYGHTSTTALDGKIWVIGGRDSSHNIVPQVDVYDPLRDSWITFETGLGGIRIVIPVVDGELAGLGLEEEVVYGVSHHVAFGVDGGEGVVLVGGFDGEYEAVGFMVTVRTQQSLDSFFTGDRVGRLVYEVGPELVVARGGLSVVQWRTGRGGNEVWVMGGWTEGDGWCEAMTSVERYDFIQREWVLLGGGGGGGGLNVGRAGAGGFVVDGEEEEEGGGVERRRFLVVYGGERRGRFERETGLCHEGTAGAEGGEGSWWSGREHWWKKDGGVGGSGGGVLDDCGLSFDTTPLEENRLLPRRITCPVRSIEVLEVTAGVDLSAAKWIVSKDTTPDELMYRYAIQPWPITHSIYLFGGIQTPPKSPSPPNGDTTRTRTRTLTQRQNAYIPNDDYYDEGLLHYCNNNDQKDDDDDERCRSILRMSNAVYVRLGFETEPDPFPPMVMMVALAAALSAVGTVVLVVWCWRRSCAGGGGKEGGMGGEGEREVEMVDGGRRLEEREGGWIGYGRDLGSLS